MVITGFRIGFIRLVYKYFDSHCIVFMSINIIEVVITHLRRIAASLPSKNCPQMVNFILRIFSNISVSGFVTTCPEAVLPQYPTLLTPWRGAPSPCASCTCVPVRPITSVAVPTPCYAYLNVSPCEAGWSPHRPGITGTDLRSPQDPSKGGARAARTEWVAGVFDEIILVANWCYEIHYFECVLLVVFAVARHEFYLLT